MGLLFAHRKEKGTRALGVGRVGGGGGCDVARRSERPRALKRSRLRGGKVSEAEGVWAAGRSLFLPEPPSSEGAAARARVWKNC